MKSKGLFKLGMGPESLIQPCQYGGGPEHWHVVIVRKSGPVYNSCQLSGPLRPTQAYIRRFRESAS